MNEPIAKNAQWVSRIHDVPPLFRSNNIPFSRSMGILCSNHPSILCIQMTTILRSMGILCLHHPSIFRIQMTNPIRLIQYRCKDLRNVLAAAIRYPTTGDPSAIP